MQKNIIRRNGRNIIIFFYYLSYDDESDGEFSNFELTPESADSSDIFDFDIN